MSLRNQIVKDQLGNDTPSAFLGFNASGVPEVTTVPGSGNYFITKNPVTGKFQSSNLTESNGQLAYEGVDNFGGLKVQWADGKGRIFSAAPNLSVVSVSSTTTLAVFDAAAIPNNSALQIEVRMSAIMTNPTAGNAAFSCVAKGLFKKDNAGTLTFVGGTPAATPEDVFENTGGTVDEFSVLLNSGFPSARIVLGVGSVTYKFSIHVIANLIVI